MNLLKIPAVIITPTFAAGRKAKAQRRAARFRFGKPTKYKLSVYRRCGFKAEHPCQMDVDHVLPKSMGGMDGRRNT